MMTTTKSIFLAGFLGLFLSSLTACNKAPQYQGEVKLSIDGQNFQYTTDIAEMDLGGGQTRPSLYFRRDDAQGKQPSLSLRYYQGQPVGKIWFNWKSDDDEKMRRYECFIPGQLQDGQPTLGWKKSDGTKRERNETGEADCQVKMTRSDKSIRIAIDAHLHPARPQKKKLKKAKGVSQKQDNSLKKLHISGTATLVLTSRKP